MLSGIYGNNSWLGGAEKKGGKTKSLHFDVAIGQ